MTLGENVLMRNVDELGDLILDIARVPSFTSHEERLHPLIKDFCADLGNISLSFVGNNVILESEGEQSAPVVALSAHLDKINHFGKEKRALSAERIDNDGSPGLSGLLDDAVGIGICLHLLRQSAHRRFPPLQILLSECEESAMFRSDRDLLKNGGEGLSPGIGAERIAGHLVATGRVPRLVIVVDVTPLFRGNPGIALYSNHWENHGAAPSEPLINRTEMLAEQFQGVCPRMQRRNNVNDYVTYGRQLNREGLVTPCFAVEPSVGGYHSPEETVYDDDLVEVVAMLTQLLESGKLTA